VGLAAVAGPVAEKRNAAAAIIGIGRMENSNQVAPRRTPEGFGPIPIKVQNGNFQVASVTFSGPSRGRPATLLGVVMEFVQQTAAVRFEWSVDGAGRAAGVGARGKALAAPPRGIVADRQVALDQV